MKRMMLLAATVAAWCSWGAESISVDEVANHYPWDGKVDCVYTLSGVEAGYAYNGVFTLSVKKDGATIRRVVTNDLGEVAGTYTNTFNCTTLFGAGYYPNGGIALALVKKAVGVQLWADGPYFATCNVGASKPEEYGYYFWWGDTVGYKRNAANDGWNAVDGSATGFQFNSSNSKIVTYNKTVAQLTSAGYIDGTGNLAANYDAATAHLGAPWRMLTLEERSKLMNTKYCTQTWTDNWNGTGVAGYVLTGATTGYTDKSIFFPAAGYGADSNRGFSYNYYWLSTPSSTDSRWANYQYFYQGYFGGGASERSKGCPVRPVRSAE